MTDPADLPLVSVIMATYNCRDTLAEALESIANQSYARWELVVCDDASQDDTVEMLHAFADQHPGRVVVLRNEVNSQLSYSLNRCLEHVSGELVARMDADDKSTPERLERQVAYLREHPDVDLVGTAMRRFDSEGTKDVVELPARPDRFSLRRGVPFAHATVMLHRRVYQELGGYTVSTRTMRGQDYDLWFRFHARGFVGHNLAESLYLVREDAAAVRRRTFTVRWRAYQTTIIGFRTLGYPLHWNVAPTLGLAKALVPARAVMRYRAFQHSSGAKRQSSGARTS